MRVNPLTSVFFIVSKDGCLHRGRIIWHIFSIRERSSSRTITFLRGCVSAIPDRCSAAPCAGYPENFVCKTVSGPLSNKLAHFCASLHLLSFSLFRSHLVSIHRDWTSRVRNVYAFISITRVPCFPRIQILKCECFQK